MEALFIELRQIHKDHQVQLTTVKQLSKFSLGCFIYFDGAKMDQFTLASQSILTVTSVWNTGETHDIYVPKLSAVLV